MADHASRQRRRAECGDRSSELIGYTLECHFLAVEYGVAGFPARLVAQPDAAGINQSEKSGAARVLDASMAENDIIGAQVVHETLLLVRRQVLVEFPLGRGVRNSEIPAIPLEPIKRGQ